VLPFDIQAVFGNDFSILGRNHRLVADIPNQGFKEWVYERLPHVRFLDAGCKKCDPIRGEVSADLLNFFLALIERLCS
jgi:hypothetical protein